MRNLFLNYLKKTSFLSYPIPFQKIQIHVASIPRLIFKYLATFVFSFNVRNTLVQLVTSPAKILLHAFFVHLLMDVFRQADKRGEALNPFID